MVEGKVRIISSIDSGPVPVKIEVPDSSDVMIRYVSVGIPWDTVCDRNRRIF
jgi:hypothetical protein